ncbi:MAG: DUF993 family protein [Geminicoccaceae bacterium]
MTTLRLPTETGTIEPYTLQGEALPPPHGKPVFNRVAMAAAHVVSDPLSAIEPSAGGAVDWERTLAYRDHLFGHGLAVAEAMDTAQRGVGLDWPTALELIRRSVEKHARHHKGASSSPAAAPTSLDPADASSLDDVIGAYLIPDGRHPGGRRPGHPWRPAPSPVSPAAPTTTPASTAQCWPTPRSRSSSTGSARCLDPALAGYWGGDDFDRTMATCLAVISDNVAKVDGIKVSLLDAEGDRHAPAPAGGGAHVLRRRLPTRP